MILSSAPQVEHGRVLEVGCGLGLYVSKLAEHAAEVVGCEFEGDRARSAAAHLAPLPNSTVVSAANEALPFCDGSFDVVLTNEVIEHVRDDRLSARELVRVVRRGGRIVLFCPNRWYPVEQHGVFWRGEYHFGNVPLVNYLPDPLRDRLAPHVRTYSLGKLRDLFDGLPVKEVSHRRIYGGYDNIVAKFGAYGRSLRDALQRAEGTRLDFFGLSHLLVLERVC